MILERRTAAACSGWRTAGRRHRNVPDIASHEGGAGTLGRVVETRRPRRTSLTSSQQRNVDASPCPRRSREEFATTTQPLGRSRRSQRCRSRRRRRATVEASCPSRASTRRRSRPAGRWWPGMCGEPPTSALPAGQTSHRSGSEALVLAEHVLISRPPTPMSPAGTSVPGPMWRESSVMKPGRSA